MAQRARVYGCSHSYPPIVRVGLGVAVGTGVDVAAGTGVPVSARFAGGAAVVGLVEAVEDGAAVVGFGLRPSSVGVAMRVVGLAVGRSVEDGGGLPSDPGASSDPPQAAEAKAAMRMNRVAKR